MASQVLNELDDVIDFVINNKGRSNSCDAIPEVDEEDDDIDIDEERGAKTHDGHPNAPSDADRKAAALRIIRKAKRAGGGRDRAYSTSEDSQFGPTPGAPPRVVKNMRKSRTGLGRGLPKKGIC
jgi:hypothetical protein